jgi:hypothetical protein
MKLSTSLLLPAVFVAAPFIAAPTGSAAPTEREALRQAANPSLELLRAGAPTASNGFLDAERDRLRAAQEQSRGIEDLRAGDVSFSNDQLTIILLVVIAVILIIAIA